MTRTRNEYITGITKRLDTAQMQLGTIERVKRQGKTIDESLTDTWRATYEVGLKHLNKLGATEEHRAYTAWYERYLNGGDPL